MSDRRVKIGLELDAKGFTDGSKQASEATRELQKAVLEAEKAATQSAGKVEAAKRKEADATGKVRVAEEQLTQARAKGDPAKIVAAEEKLASAKRDAEAASKQLTDAENASATAAESLASAQEQLAAETDKTATSMERLGGFIDSNRQEMQTAGRALAGFGAGLTALAVGSTKLAIDWQSDWAGVQKTNDGTHEQMVRLEADLREMARTLPSTHTEIAAVAEAAGQLGIGVEDVASFSRVMIDLGQTTNLSADEAATAIARFSNVMGTSSSDADRLGSTIVDLGNNFATTEAEIVHMAQRIAPVGRIMNMTESDVLAMATAMSSVGIEAEAGGTAISMVMRKIDADVREGAESVQGWADAAGVSAEEFATAWESRPAEAMEILSRGLGETAASGGDVAAVLTDLGVKGIRESATMLSLASASDVLSDALGVGANAWEENTALANEAMVRYETAEAKIAMAMSSIKDAAISVGSSLVPVVADIAGAIASVADWFGSLPEPVLGAVSALSGVAGVGSLAAGGLLMVAPAALDTYRAFQSLGRNMPKVISGLKGIGIAGAVAVGVGALAGAASALYNNTRDAAPAVSDLGMALTRLKESSDIADIDSMFQFDAPITSINSFAEAVDHISLDNPLDHIRSFGTGLFGLNNTLAQSRETITNLDQALAVMDASEAASQVNRLRQELEFQGDDSLSHWDNLKELFPEYAESVTNAAQATHGAVSDVQLLQLALGGLPSGLKDVKNASDEAARQDQLVGALEDVGLAADGTVESLSDYLDMLFQTGLAEMSSRDATAAYHDAIRGVGETVKQITDPESGLGGLSKALNKNKTDFNLTSEAGMTANSSFQGVAKSGMDMASAMANAGASQEEVTGALESTHKALIDAAAEFGITGEAAETLAERVLGVPEHVDIQTWMDGQAHEMATQTRIELMGLPDGVDIDSFMSDAAERQAILTKSGIEDVPNSKDILTYMSDDAFVEALATRAAVLDIPDEDVINSFMDSVARDEADKTTAAVLGIPEGASISSWMSDDARKEAMSLNNWLDAIDGRHTKSSHTHTQNIVHNTLGIKESPVGPYAPGKGPGRAKGGRAPDSLPGFTHGGRLPRLGLGGVDQIIGVNALGLPFVRVDEREWIVNRRASDKFDRTISLINQDHPSVQHLAGFAGGGSPGREWSAGSVGASAPQVNVSAPAVDTAGIEAAVARAISSYQPVVNIGGRQFAGLMVETQKQVAGMGAR